MLQSLLYSKSNFWSYGRYRAYLLTRCFFFSEITLSIFSEFIRVDPATCVRFLHPIFSYLLHWCVDFPVAFVLFMSFMALSISPFSMLYHFSSYCVLSLLFLSLCLVVRFSYRRALLCSRPRFQEIVVGW